jgi:hypothetical protein
MNTESLKTWCPRCREQVTLVNLRPWPEGVLVIGECFRCRAALAVSRPLGWSLEVEANGSQSVGAGPAA